MPNKTTFSKYFVAIAIGACLAALLTVIEKSYSRLLEVNQKIIPPATIKITNPKLDTELVDILEKQYQFNTSDITPIQISTISATPLQ